MMTRRKPSPVRWECRACGFPAGCTVYQVRKPIKDDGVCSMRDFRRVSKKKGGREMTCPTCEQELLLIDYFGRIASHQDGHVEGDIYQCENEDCESYQEYYHTHRSTPDELHNGYPC
jgi:hypothetical protein